MRCGTSSSSPPTTMAPSRAARSRRCPAPSGSPQERTRAELPIPAPVRCAVRALQSLHHPGGVGGEQRHAGAAVGAGRQGHHHLAGAGIDAQADPPRAGRPAPAHGADGAHRAGALLGGQVYCLGIAMSHGPKMPCACHHLQRLDRPRSPFAANALPAARTVSFGEVSLGKGEIERRRRVLGRAFVSISTRHGGAGPRLLLRGVGGGAEAGQRQGAGGLQAGPTLSAMRGRGVGAAGAGCARSRRRSSGR